MTDPVRRSLIALRRLRRVRTDEARRDLSEVLGSEAALLARDAALAEALENARRLTGDFDRDSLAAWRRRVTMERDSLAGALRDAAARTAAARDALAAQRAAETVTADVIARLAAESASESERRDQIVLEDTSRALGRREAPKGE